MLFLAERVVRKWNVVSPALDNLELGEFDPPNKLSKSEICLMKFKLMFKLSLLYNFHTKNVEGEPN